jgi:hypothetical protein
MITKWTIKDIKKGRLRGTLSAMFFFGVFVYIISIHLHGGGITPFVTQTNKMADAAEK